MAGIPFPRARTAPGRGGGYQPASRPKAPLQARTPLARFVEGLPPEVRRYAQDTAAFAVMVAMRRVPFNDLIEFANWWADKTRDRQLLKGAVALPAHQGFRQTCRGDPTGHNRVDLYRDSGSSFTCGSQTIMSPSPPVSAGTNAYESIEVTPAIPPSVPSYAFANGTWARIAGYPGPARPYATPSPREVPEPWRQPDPWVEVAPFVDPFQLPIQQPFEIEPLPYPMIPYRSPNPERSPVEQPQRGPATDPARDPARDPAVAPVPNPIPMPRPFPQPRPVHNTAPGVAIEPDGSLVFTPPALGLSHFPSLGQRDVKGADRAAAAVLRKVSAVTEAKDLVKAMYDALPRSCKSWKKFSPSKGTGVITTIGKRDRKGRPATPSMVRQMGDISRCAAHVAGGGAPQGGAGYWARVNSNILANEVQDRIFGTMGKAIGTQSRKQGRPIGYQAGDAM